MNRSTRLASLPFLLLATPAFAQSGGLPPSGSYTCTLLSGSMLMTLGTLQVDGASYSGFSGDDWSEMTLNPDGTIAFTDSFAGIPDGFEVQGGAVLESSSGPYLEITYSTPSGWTEGIDCTRE